VCEVEDYSLLAYKTDMETIILTFFHAVLMGPRLVCIVDTLNTVVEVVLGRSTLLGLLAF
jgi:hypothetical protein